MVGMMESWASGHHHKYGGFVTGGPHEQGIGGASADSSSATSLAAMTAAAMGSAAGNGSSSSSRGSLGKLIERSTSAPPSSTLSSEGYLKSEGYVRHGGSGKPFGGLSLVGGVRTVCLHRLSSVLLVSYKPCSH